MANGSLLHHFRTTHRDRSPYLLKGTTSSWTVKPTTTRLPYLGRFKSQFKPQPQNDSSLSRLIHTLLNVEDSPRLFFRVNQYQNLGGQVVAKFWGDPIMAPDDGQCLIS